MANNENKEVAFMQLKKDITTKVSASPNQPMYMYNQHQQEKVTGPFPL
jgi:hypothetical protein